MGRFTHLALGLAQADQEPDPLSFGEAGDVEQFERLAVIGDGFVRGELCQGAVPGLGGVVDGPSAVGGRC